MIEGRYELDISSGFKLENAYGGKSNILQYYQVEDRIAFQSDFMTIKIVPMLHRNTISTLGMRDWDYYLALKHFED